METKTRLGRGLNALLGEGNDGHHTPAVEPSQLIPVGWIQHNPYQPRKIFDDEQLSQLTESIRNHGVLQPLVVRQAGETFQLIAGERRLRAAQVAGLSEVPVHVVDFDDRQVLEAALAENIQRSDLNPIEKAEGFKDYLDRYGVSKEELAKRLGMDRTSVSNLVGLLNLPADVQKAVRLEQISLGHAKILKGLNDTDLQISLAKEVMLKGLSVKALELMVKQVRTEPANEEEAKPAKSVASAVEKTTHVLGIETELRQKFATRFEIRLRGESKGAIVINFENNDDFERVVEMLRK
jgi:ParB family transcriptional regulator, chromosome partitioning protein